MTELELKEKELELRERELAIREKELQLQIEMNKITTTNVNKKIESVTEEYKKTISDDAVSDKDITNDNMSNQPTTYIDKNIIRPKSINYVIYICCFYIISSFVQCIFQLNHYINYRISLEELCGSLLIIPILIFCYFKIRAGINWARMLFAVFSVIFIAIYSYGAYYLLENKLTSAFFVILLMLMLPVLSLYFLFCEDSSNWFSYIKNKNISVSDVIDANMKKELPSKKEKNQIIKNAINNVSSVDSTVENNGLDDNGNSDKDIRKAQGEEGAVEHINTAPKYDGCLNEYMRKMNGEDTKREQYTVDSSSVMILVITIVVVAILVFAGIVSSNQYPNPRI